MSVILHNVNTFPPVDTSWYGTLDKLDEYDNEGLETKGITEAWYWYATGSYEGSGQLIGRDSGGSWVHMDLGHCSCYGPTESRAGISRHDSLEALRTSMSADLAAECGNLFAAIEGAA
jgi:hypothetical protein